MEIISNSPNSTNNHLSLLKQLLSEYDSALFVSPYLFDNFDAFFKDISVKNKQIELITSCAPRGLEQLKKPNSITSFAMYMKKYSGQWPKIHLNQKLHSKIYIFFRKNIPKVGIVTSANLTRNGLSNNTETGVLIRDSSILSSLHNSSLEDCDYINISKKQLSQLCDAADKKHTKLKLPKDVNIGLDDILNNHFTPSDSNKDIKIRPNAKYFIKVSGVSHKPVLPENKQTFGQKNRRLSFAKRPSSIKIGDCLLEVAIGGKCFLSYHSCTTRIFEYTDAEKKENPDYKRWNYYTESNNLSSEYGYNWYKKPIYYNDVIEKFKKENPEIPVTANGKDHIIGAISIGNSYFRVTKEFGEFVIKLIDDFSQ